ncbi:glycosyltransferase involved in cell wall biosynthesis [Marmoricola sp. OAE513]|uniref:glycosyltransferase family 2 protein n=1 Tax=Marmoricola sp. OAE513 TaxID=2817894 RepID=UPI001AE9C223
MRISVVVPCFNEADGIDRLAEVLAPVLEALGGGYEVILVDDGSSDGTLDRLRAICAERAGFRYLALSRNFGKEGAMLAGLTEAKGEAVAIMDADLQHPPALLGPMVELLDAGYEQVVARRDRQGDPRFRTFVSRLYYRFVNGLMDVDLEDGAGDFRVLDRRALDALLSLGESNRFSKGLFAWIGFRTTYLDYRNEARYAGTSKWSTTQLLNYGLDSVVSFNYKPLRLAIHVGAAITAVAVVYGLWVVVDAIIAGNSVPGYVTLICAITGLGGLQMVMLGVIGEYLGRIYVEVKHRPNFLVRERSEDDGPVT